tara:strand:+ start:1493 stop:2125 length:633 start_codon:yes stop_codon:yes gene_type:complete
MSKVEESSGIPTVQFSSWKLKNREDFDIDMLKLLIEERNYHYDQIMAINGRLGFFILGIVASVFFGGEDVRNSMNVEVWAWPIVLLVVGSFFFLLAIVLTANAVVEHWRIRMVWVRRFECAIDLYTHGATIEEALGQAEKEQRTRPGGKPISAIRSMENISYMFSAHPDWRPCEMLAVRHTGINSHMRFGIAASAFLISGFVFLLLILQH